MKKLLYCMQIVITAVLIGLTVSLFLFVSHEIFKLNSKLIKVSNDVFVVICLFTFAITTLIAIANRRFIGHIGSGIGELEDYFEENKEYNPIVKLLVVAINSYCAYFEGFIFGTEAPSIFIGASVSKITSKIFRTKDDKDIVMASASAGFAVAFLTPISGLFHLIEEHKKNITLKLMAKAIFIIGIAFATAFLVYRRNPFEFLKMKWLPIKYLWVALLVSFLATCSGLLYRNLHKLVNPLSKRGVMVLFTPILGIGFMILTRYKALFSGSGELSVEENLLDYSLLFLFGLLIIRAFGMMMSESSYLSGGSVLPLLALGAISANIIIVILDKVGLSLVNYRDIIILTGMCVCFGVGASVPLTGVSLGLELTYSLKILPPIIIAMIFAIILKKIANLAFGKKNNSKALFEQNDTV